MLREGQTEMSRSIVVLSCCFGLVCLVAGCGGNSSATKPPSPVTVQVSPNSITVLRGMSQRFTANVSGTSNTAVTWNVQENSQGFDVGTIDGTGLYTAPQNAEGTFHVVATSQADATPRGLLR